MRKYILPFTVLLMVVGAYTAYAAFTLPGVQGPSQGDNNVNPYTLAKAINENNQVQVTNQLTAEAGGTQALATQLSYGINEVATVAGAADGVQLPICVPGAVVYVSNAGAASMQVFGKNGRTDTINGTAGATGVAQANGITALYICTRTVSNVQGTWRRLLSA